MKDFAVLLMKKRKTNEDDIDLPNPFDGKVFDQLEVTLLCFVGYICYGYNVL